MKFDDDGTPGRNYKMTENSDSTMVNEVSYLYYVLSMLFWKKKLLILKASIIIA